VTLNPALEGAKFCPRCGAQARVEFPRSLHCASCGYAVFFNPKPVGCAIPRAGDGRVWLARRAFDPGRGRWSMPGGFVDLGETVQGAIVRELNEELGVSATLGRLVGVYSHADEPVLVVVYEATLDGEPRAGEEVLEVRRFPREELPWDELAFWTDAAALGDLLD
jgi:ADP-ribose pyrophosphatase YjhB (NUDIX family)